jgi:hypothetical protein
MLGQPLFPGESGIDQLVEIIKVLGTPSREQIKTMNPNYMEHKFPQIKPHPFSKVSCRRFLLHLGLNPDVGVPGLPTPHGGRSDRPRFKTARVHPRGTSECD